MCMCMCICADLRSRWLIAKSLDGEHKALQGDPFDFRGLGGLADVIVGEAGEQMEGHTRLASPSASAALLGIGAADGNII